MIQTANASSKRMAKEMIHPH